MTGLDVGRLAGYHRNDLVADMRKCRMAEMVERPEKAGLHVINRRVSILYPLGILMERCGRRLQRTGMEPASQR